MRTKGEYKGSRTGRERERESEGDTGDTGEQDRQVQKNITGLAANAAPWQQERVGHNGHNPAHTLKHVPHTCMHACTERARAQISRVRKAAALAKAGLAGNMDQLLVSRSV